MSSIFFFGELKLPLPLLCSGLGAGQGRQRNFWKLQDISSNFRAASAMEDNVHVLAALRSERQQNGQPSSGEIDRRSKPGLTGGFDFDLQKRRKVQEVSQTLGDPSILAGRSSSSTSKQDVMVLIVAFVIPSWAVTACLFWSHARHAFCAAAQMPAFLSSVQARFLRSDGSAIGRTEQAVWCLLCQQPPPAHYA